MSQHPQIAVMTPEQIISYVREAVRSEMGYMVREAVKRPSVKESFKPEQAAEYLNQSVNTLRQWRSQGRGPAYEKRGRTIRYKLEDLDAWRNANRVLTGEALESLHGALASKRSLPATGASHD